MLVGDSGKKQPFAVSLVDRLNATALEAAELRKLIAFVLKDADDKERADALAIALADPEAALTSFRLLAHDLREQATWGRNAD